jgi:hypothetical protein
LAKSIAASTKQNVMFQAGVPERAPAFKYDPEDLNEFARAVQKATGFRRAPGGDHVFSHGRLPSFNFGVRAIQRTLNDQAWQQGGPMPENVLKDGKVTIKHEAAQATTVQSLPRNMLDKPLEIHWLFDNLAFKANATEMPADEFLKFVAKAVGGRLLARQDRYFLDIDPGEIQRRATTTVTEAQKTPRFQQLSAREQIQAELSRTMIASLSASQISTLLATNAGSLRLELSGTMRPVATRYVQALLAAENEEQGVQTTEGLRGQAEIVIELQRGQRGERGQGRISSALLRRLDPRIVGYATINSQFNVRLELLALDNLGRPSRLIPIP